MKISINTVLSTPGNMFSNSFFLSRVEEEEPLVLACLDETCKKNRKKLLKYTFCGNKPDIIMIIKEILLRFQCFPWHQKSLYKM